MLNDAILAEDYKRMNMEQVAEKHGVSLTTVFRHLQSMNIPTIKSSIKTVEFTKIHQEVITGSLLGDGSLCMPKNSKSAFFRIEHSIKQAAYLQYKYLLIEQLCKLAPRGNSTRIAMTTANHPALTDIYRQWYPESKKIVPFGEIEKHLTPLGLAIWYLDDGGIRNHGISGSIATASFTFDEVEQLADFLLNKYNIHASVHSDRNYPRLYIPGKGHFIPNKGWENSTSEFVKFTALIRPYIPSSMLYKLGKA